jgi:hypothetical protein
MEETKVKRPRGRPRKNPLPEEPKPKRPRGRPRKNIFAEAVAKTAVAAPHRLVKDYCIITPDDLRMWIESTGRALFVDALNQHNKLTKAKVSTEIRWHTDRIDVVAK